MSVSSWESVFDFESAPAGVPAFVHIARQLSTDIRRGRFRPGDRLPSSRRLAAQLHVSRNTVVAAYDELLSEGWVRGDSTRGTFVSNELPARTIRRPAPASYPSEPGYSLPAARAPAPPPPRPASLLRLLGGVPELRLLPLASLARAYRRALLGADGTSLLDYADPSGDQHLRAALASMLANVRGIAAPEEAITTTRGSQQGLYLVARALLSPGDVVAVEAMGYPQAWDALRQSGARLVPVPVDSRGIDVEALAALARHEAVRAVYVTPHHQYPTTVSLSAERRLRLLELARARRMTILEDDYDHEFHYERPQLPLAATDHHGSVVYFGTFSKLLAPGLRLGYVVAPPPVARHVAAYRRIVDHQGDCVLERAIATLLEEGEIQRHASKATKVYRARRDLICQALKRYVPALVVEPPQGGMAIWAHAPGIDVDGWVARAREAGVAVQSGARFTFDGSSAPYLRIGFAACNERELVDAVRRLGRTIPRR